MNHLKGRSEYMMV